jgi:hypothetical protein
MTRATDGIRGCAFWALNGRFRRFFAHNETQRRSRSIQKMVTTGDGD